MVNITEKFEEIRSEYILLTGNIITAYNVIAKDHSFKLEKKDVITSLDAFVQSILLGAIFSERKLEAGELNVIKKLPNYFDVYREITINKEVVPNDKQNSELLDICNECLGQVPTFVLMSIYIDRELEQSFIKSEPTFSGYVYHSLKKILKIIDVYDNKIIEKLLAIVRQTFEENKILYL